MSKDVIPTLIIFSSMSVFNIFLGYIIKKYKMADIISGFDRRKDDPDIVCKIVGDNFILMGLLGILLGVVYYFVKEKMSVIIYIIAFMSIMILTIINMLIRYNMYGKKTKD